MEVFGKFMKATSQGMKATRVVPIKTEIEDLKTFRLMPYETIDLFESKGRKYITLNSKINVGHIHTLQRLKSITIYLRALHRRSLGK
jgi:hypothetical protein